MTEKSYFWDGAVTGDATLSPYTVGLYQDIWRKIFLRDRTIMGVIRDYENECAVLGVSGGVAIDTGAALIDGVFYENDSKMTISIPTPSASTRIDVIALRKNPAAQTVRATRIAGVEGGSAPSVTQITNGTWDVKLAEVSITTGGIISTTDFRKIAHSPMMRAGKNYELIEIAVPEKGDTEVSILTIPQTYTHLFVYATGQIVTTAVDGMVGMYLNQDTTLANYMYQGVSETDPTLTGLASIAPTCVTLSAFPDETTPYIQGSGLAIIPFYATSDWYKVFSVKELETDTRTMWLYSWLWESTSPVTSLLFKLKSGSEVFSSNCQFSLYGVK